MSEHAYSNSDPAVVAQFIAAAEAARAAGLRAIAAAETLGRNKGPAVTPGMWSIADTITGLFPDDPTNPPDGWVYVARHATLRPQRGPAGDSARTWFADNPLVPDARAVIARSGLPYYSRTAGEGMRYRLARPHVFHHDGVLWARYLGPVDGDCTWTPRRLSEFHAALEAAAATASVGEDGHA